MPLYQEPRHHVVYESPSMRIHDIQIPPATPRSSTRTTPPSSMCRSSPRGRARRCWVRNGVAAARRPRRQPHPAPAEPARPGKVNSVTTYVEKPFTHRVNNVGSTVFRLVGIANRTAGAAADTDDVSGLSATPESVNPWYRAHRLALKAGQATPRTGTPLPSWWSCRPRHGGGRRHDVEPAQRAGRLRVPRQRREHVVRNGGRRRGARRNRSARRCATVEHPLSGDDGARRHNSAAARNRTTHGRSSEPEDVGTRSVGQ